VGECAAEFIVLDLSDKCRTRPKAGDANVVSLPTRPNLDRRAHRRVNGLRARLVDQRHGAFLHALFPRKSSSARAITSTMALSMPSTS
jgi:hypothetical protein